MTGRYFGGKIGFPCARAAAASFFLSFSLFHHANLIL